MLVDAFDIIGALFAGETVTHRGEYLATEHATLWDLPDDPPRIGVAASGRRSCEIAARHDALVAVQPDHALVEQFGAAGGKGKPAVGQAALSYDIDAAAAAKRALEQFRWFTGGWNVMAELPGPRHFASASESVREADITEQIPCGPDVERHVDAVKKFVDAGFTHVALVQVGVTPSKRSSIGPSGSCFPNSASSAEYRNAPCTRRYIPRSLARAAGRLAALWIVPAAAVAVAPARCAALACCWWGTSSSSPGSRRPRCRRWSARCTHSTSSATTSTRPRRRPTRC
jgi:hypothetical protein